LAENKHPEKIPYISRKLAIKNETGGQIVEALKLFEDARLKPADDHLKPPDGTVEFHNTQC